MLVGTSTTLTSLVAGQEGHTTLRLQAVFPLTRGLVSEFNETGGPVFGPTFAAKKRDIFLATLPFKASIVVALSRYVMLCVAVVCNPHRRVSDEELSWRVNLDW